jgi:hypothetical protein
MDFLKIPALELWLLDYQWYVLVSSQVLNMHCIYLIHTRVYFYFIRSYAIISFEPLLVSLNKIIFSLYV